MTFFQSPPRLGNQYDDDAMLREYLARSLPTEVLSDLEPELRHLGELAAGPLHEMQLRDRRNEPILTQWDPWGARVDEIELTPLWCEAKRLSVAHGLVATGYEPRYGEHARVAQFALNYVVQASLDVYSCPLAMTDGAATTLLGSGNEEIVARALPRLLSRDEAGSWTSGQWMTERAGGSDVGLSETVALRKDGTWRLHGTKWFTSAVTSEMALTLARPEGNGPGGRGLALFYVETRLEDGRLNGIRVNRLKEKLGTRKVPTAELELDGTIAVPVAGLSDGVRAIAPMLNVTRTWNAVASAFLFRRAVALAKDYSHRRAQFGATLSEKPLHRDTLAGLEAELDGAFLLAFRAVEALGAGDAALLRALAPIAKLTTAKQGVAGVAESIECLGGAGYVEDTGLPLILRDAHVLPIWEGTTNVLSLDALRALVREETIEAIASEGESAVAAVRDPRLEAPASTARSGLARAVDWLGRASEAGARRWALTLGRSLELAYLCQHAQWCLDAGSGPRAAVAARRFARHGVDLIMDDEDDTLLTG